MRKRANSGSILNPFKSRSLFVLRSILFFFLFADLAWENVNLGSTGLRFINGFVWLRGELDPGTGVKNNDVEKANLLADGLICLCHIEASVFN